MKEKELLLEAFNKGLLNEKGCKKLIEILLNPIKEKLQEEYSELLQEDHSCLKGHCELREKMKGHPVNCKNKNCLERIKFKCI